MKRSFTALVTAATLLTLVRPGVAHAQFKGLKDRIKQKTEEKITKEIENKADKGADKALAGAEKVIKCVVTDRACIRKAKEQGQQVVVTNPNGTPVSTADSARAIAQATAGMPEKSTTPAESPKRIGEGAWANYDFVPGDRTLFYEDFTRDQVGDFPRRLTFKAGNMEVAEWNGGRYLRATQSGEFAIPLPAVLPERFTVEIDVYQGARRNSWGAMELRFGGRTSPNYISANWTRGGVYGAVESETDIGQEKFANDFVPVRVTVDGQHVKVYMGDVRVANVPAIDLGRSKEIWVKLPGTPESPAFLGTVRVAAGGKKLYEALAAAGHVATQGIYFATGSAEILPQSTPTLKEIQGMLDEHPELKLEVEGHTDNVGDAAANQALSERRAQSVVAYLTAAGVDASRLTAKGYGATRPVGSNTTAEGRAANRRVELAIPGARKATK